MAVQPMRRAVAMLLLAMVVAAGLVLARGWRGGTDDEPSDGRRSPEASRETIARGAYLARAGNCAACHTARGGAPYAGGRGIDTPFGTVYSTNLTSDAATGLGAWTASDFWRAMHHGRSRDGRLLYPAFPYPNYTQVTRADSDAIFAFLRTVPAVDQPNRAHALRFPYDSQLALAAWRGLFFTPGVFEPEPGRPAEWNRGAYLVRGLGHCSACHAPRNALGATREGQALAGGPVSAGDWYAPSLSSAEQAGVADWPASDVIDLLRDGLTARASVTGPMAEVVLGSTQHLTGPDLQAIATYLQALPPARASRATRRAEPAGTARLERGAALYEARCADCHGDAGQGRPGAYPALAGNRAVTMEPPSNAIRTVLSGGFAPATAGNPRPFGMPPFFQSLDNAEVAAVLTFVRASWGNAASAVSAREVDRHRQRRAD